MREYGDPEDDDYSDFDEGDEDLLESDYSVDPDELDLGVHGDDLDSEYYEDDTSDEGEEFDEAVLEEDEEEEISSSRLFDDPAETRRIRRHIAIVTWLRSSRFAKPLTIAWRGLGVPRNQQDVPRPGRDGIYVDEGQHGTLRSGEVVEILAWLRREGIIESTFVGRYVLEMDRTDDGSKARLNIWPFL